MKIQANIDRLRDADDGTPAGRPNDKLEKHAVVVSEDSTLPAGLCH